MKSIKQERDQILKDKSIKNKIPSGSKADDKIETVSDASDQKTRDLEWNISPDAVKESSKEKEDIDTLIKKIEAKSQEENINPKEIENVLQKILDSDWGDEAQESAEPIHMLSLEKDQELFYSLHRKFFVPIKNNIEVIPIENPFGPTKKTNFYLINNEIFDIDPEKVIMVGWN